LEIKVTRASNSFHSLFAFLYNKTNTITETMTDEKSGALDPSQ
jgi:hypothetical protein